MIVFLFFRLKRTALCRGTRKLIYGNCKVGWQCVYIRQGLINWCYVCWMFLVMWMHTASLSVCKSHSSQCNKIILFTSNRNHSLLQLSHALQCLDKIQLANVSASFRSQSWWHFVQVMHSVLHTCWDLYELVCISVQLPASGIDSSQISWLYIQGVTGGTDQTSGECSLC